MAFLYFLIGPAVTAILGVVIILAWRATPARRNEAPNKTPLLRSHSFIVSIALGALPGWLITSDYQRAEQERAATCANVGRCHVDSTIRWEGLGALRGIVMERRFFTHAAHAAADCRASQSCRFSGECSVDRGRCIATSEEDCRVTPACARYGDCSPLDGKCGIHVDADCQGSDPCRESGLCAASNGACVALSNDDCASSTACKMQGRCAARAGACERVAPPP
ncbi:MAG: hypothetical protein U0414_18940 [Polyangiaceae bacterium]